LNGMEEERLKFEYGVLATRVYARETSTLTFAALTTAGALAFLAILLQGVKAPPRGLYVIGVGVSLVGFAYRELTVFTIDRKEVGRMTVIENDRRIFPNRLPRPHWLGTFLRRFAFRCVIFSPAVVFMRYYGWYTPNPWGFVLTVGSAIPLALTCVEQAVEYVQHRKARHVSGGWSQESPIL
jgi:hypothetical protein